MFDNYIKQREDYFKFLLSFNYDFQLWKVEWSKWENISNLQYRFDELVRDIHLHREILPHEWVFDIDANDWNSCYELAVKLEEKLNEYKIPFNRWSSGRLLHYHVFFDQNQFQKEEAQKLKEVSKELKAVLKFHFFGVLKKTEFTIEDVRQLEIQIHRAIPLLFISEIPQSENAKIDSLKFKSNKVLIRLEGSINEKTGAYKSYLAELPKEQPLIKVSWKVQFPTQVQTWKPNIEDYYTLFVLAYEKFVKSEEFKNIKVFKTKGNKIAWIEKVLNSTFTDGRKRLIDLVLLPYLINVRRVNPEEAVQIVLDWALKNHEISPIMMNGGRRMTLSSLTNYIRYRAKRIAKQKLMPLSYKGTEKWFSDCEEVMKFIASLTVRL
jgi:hypothetical protein